MSRESKTVANLKGQLSKFSGIISKGFNKAKKKLINLKTAVLKEFINFTPSGSNPL